MITKMTIYKQIIFIRKGNAGVITTLDLKLQQKK